VKIIKEKLPKINLKTKGEERGRRKSFFSLFLSRIRKKKSKILFSHIFLFSPNSTSYATFIFSFLLPFVDCPFFLPFLTLSRFSFDAARHFLFETIFLRVGEKGAT